MPAWKQTRRTLSVLLVLAMLAGLLPAMTLHVRAAEEAITFTTGAVLLDSSYSGKNVIIQNGVFSVTVSGAADVNIIFDSVTIDRRYSTDTLNGTQVENLYDVSTDLGWNGAAPVCPFLITGNSSVTAAFRGTCTFYAGTNGCTVASDNTYYAAAGGAGYAGIQVDSGSSLTIEYAEKLTVYGAHQLGTPDSNGNITANGVTANYSDMLRANTTITAAGYTDPWNGSPYTYPSGVGINKTSGGAGIGGGAAYNTTTSSGSTYTQGTPGTIIINGGSIEAFGGHQAAGIGGGLNGAATTDKIVINGGTITAHGGRWAAGIGDGDSAPNDGYTDTSDSFGNSSRIEINGGTVTSYGGVASPGIGCSDGLAKEGITSGMEIAINGGAVNAFSGFPDKFSGTYHDDAPAAIGAGAKSEMESNSIYVSSAAVLSSAAFGNYAMTENGTDDDAIPVINVDSDGYLLLLRTEDYYSTAERVLELYLPQTQTIVTDTETGTETECIIYVEQATGKKYYLDQEHSQVYDETFTQLAESAVPENLTLYVDENSTKVDQIELAYYFRSIALTLPDPGLYGGLYALTVPVKGITGVTDLPDEHIILTVEAHTQGTQSGVVQYPSPNNLGKDSTAAQLTDLDAYEGVVTPGGNGLIGDDFLPGVYAYTVYVESDCTETTLYARFDDDGKTKYELYLDNKDQTTTDHGDYHTAAMTVDLMGVQQKTVRLKKMDNNSALGAIVYKVTFIKKGEYNLELSDPSKVYDGNPVSVTANSVYSGELYTIQEVVSSDTSANNTVSGQVFQQQNFRLRCNSNSRYFEFDMTGQVLTTNQPNVIHYIFCFNNMSISGAYSPSFTDSDGYYLGFEVTYPESGGSPTFKRLTAAPSGFNVEDATWISDTSSHQIATLKENNNYWSRTYNVNLEFSGTTGQIKIQYSNNSTSYTLVEFGTASLDTSGPNNQDEVYAQAQAALKTASPGDKFEYTVNETCTWTQPLTTNQITTSGNGTKNTTNVSAPNYTKQTSGYYEIVSGGSTVEYISATDEELNSAAFTYYVQTVDGEGNPVYQSIGTTPPTDAGTYKVEALIQADTYNASGSRIFTISRRPVTVLQIENWLVYKTGDEMQALYDANAETLPIPDPGSILLDNVIGADQNGVAVSVDAAGGNVYYNSITVTYASQKITLENATLTGGRAHNYSLVYNDADTGVIYVFGQIAYNMNGAIFRKTEDGAWLKFYPVDADDPVDSTTVDYHSPAESDTTYGAYLSHAEYVKARTVNESGAARYAVDIEYGAMQFTYYYSIWDVNELEYEETNGSYWVGMDGSNNKLTVVNYSNQRIQYQMTAAIDFLYADIGGTGTGITAAIAAREDGSVTIAGGTWNVVDGADPGDRSAYGTPKRSDRWLFLSGVPQMPASDTYTTVGRITVTVAPVDNSS